MPHRLARTLKLRSLSFHNAADIVEAIPINVWGWRRKLESGAEVTFLGREAELLNVQLTVAVKLPGFVSASEAQAILPQPGQCVWCSLCVSNRLHLRLTLDSSKLDDAACRLYGLHELSCMQACNVATTINDRRLASQYARATLSRWHNPAKQYYARLRLGGLAATTVL